VQGLTTRAEATDAGIIAASVTDPQAFRELFARHFGALFTYFARRLGRDAADDLTAEVFLTAFDRRARYDLAHPDARPWLFGIAANLLRRHRRAEVRRLRAHAREAGRTRDGGGDEGVERLDDRWAAGPALARALASLPRGQREALLLFAWADLGYEEIARALDVPVGTVRSRLSRARERVRRELGWSQAVAADAEDGPRPVGEELP
jgi:RNA polymerase sigma-70 factor, ECF subfamily